MNCSRMHVACQSSFDTNFRIQISTPTGQRDLKTQSPTRKPGEIHQNFPAASDSRTLEHFTSTSEPQSSQYPSPHNNPGFDPEWTFQTPVTSSAFLPEAQSFNTLQFPDTWDLGTLSPDRSMFQDHTFLNGMQAAEPLMGLPLCFDSSTMNDFQHTGHAISCEADFIWNSQSQQRTAAEWWVPGATTDSSR